jgi:hypothetical protein
VPKLAFGLDLPAGWEEQRSISWGTCLSWQQQDEPWSGRVIGRHGHPVPVGPPRKAPRQQPPPARLWPYACLRAPASAQRRRHARACSLVVVPGRAGTLDPRLVLPQSLVVVAYVEHWRLTANASWRQQLGGDPSMSMSIKRVAFLRAQTAASDRRLYLYFD